MFGNLIVRGLLAVAMVCYAVVAQATVTIDLVPVGNAHNAGELSGEGAGGLGRNRICGAVDYVYNIGKYEVTAGEYTEFLNAVAATDTYKLYEPFMWSSDYGCKIQRSGAGGSYTYSVAADRANRPVNYVSWGDAARFANWLHNDQPTGAQDLSTTEDGAYYLNGVTKIAALMAVTRKTTATWAIPTEDEWYKAAYHKNDGMTGNYWDYPTGTDAIPNNGNPEGDTGNTANFWDGDHTVGWPYWTTPVGNFGLSGSPYGTFDQGGNMFEWTESESYVGFGSWRCARGGDWDGFAYSLQASHRSNTDPASGYRAVGFRVAAAASQTYAILVGSRAPSDRIADKVRGDLDVDNVAAKLTWATDVQLIKFDWNAQDTVAIDIQNAVSAIASKAKPGDTLILFYAGHGSGGSGQGVEDFIIPVQGGGYQDNTLTSLLADERLSNVNKFVLLDSCHSEGFWKNDSAPDKDLETLTNICFLSAATEDGSAYSDPSKNNTGFFTNAILSGIKPDATFASLLALAQGAYPDTVTGYFRDDGYGTGKWQVASYFSPDFDPNTQLDGHVVPEPAALSVLAIAALCLLGYAGRRKRA